jgi:antirestriction protein
MKYDTEPRIYVGTYRAYNEGSLHGAWLDLEDYDDIDGFWEAVNELHAKEIELYGEIEPMFQDWEGIPDAFISESHLDKEVWEKWVELSETRRQVLELYLDNVNQDGTLEEAEEAYMGTFDSATDWAYEYLDDTGYLNDVPDEVKQYFDYEAWLRDAEQWMTAIRVDGEGVWIFRTDC